MNHLYLLIIIFENHHFGELHAIITSHFKEKQGSPFCIGLQSISSVVRRTLFTQNFVVLYFFFFFLQRCEVKNVCDVPLFLNLSLVQNIDLIHFIFLSHALNLC